MSFTVSSGNLFKIIPNLVQEEEFPTWKNQMNFGQRRVKFCINFNAFLDYPRIIKIFSWNICLAAIWARCLPRCYYLYNDIYYNFYISVFILFIQYMLRLKYIETKCLWQSLNALNERIEKIIRMQRQLLLLLYNINYTCRSILDFWNRSTGMCKTGNPRNVVKSFNDNRSDYFIISPNPDFKERVLPNWPHQVIEWKCWSLYTLKTLPFWFFGLFNFYWMSCANSG